jgi:hypothetical protein
VSFNERNQNRVPSSIAKMDARESEKHNVVLIENLDCDVRLGK